MKPAGATERRRCRASQWHAEDAGGVGPDGLRRDLRNGAAAAGGRARRSGDEFPDGEKRGLAGPGGEAEAVAVEVEIAVDALDLRSCEPRAAQVEDGGGLV